MDEKKTAGANYIINFFNEIQQLKVSYSQYLNIMLELEAKYGKDIENAMPDEEKHTLSVVSQNVRHACNVVYISYESIFSMEKMQYDKNVKKLYTIIISKYIIDIKVLEEFVIIINKALVLDVIKTLLESATQYYEQTSNS